VQQVGNKYCVRNTVVRKMYNIKNIQINILIKRRPEFLLMTRMMDGALLLSTSFFEEFQDLI